MTLTWNEEMAYASPGYFLDMFGQCDLGAKCKCIRGEWLGRGCLYWKPSGATTHDELREHVRSYCEKKRKEIP